MLFTTGSFLMEDFPSVLGGISADQFLSEYWQKKPLLIRNALPNFESPLSKDELAGLSLDEDIESRLVFEQGQSKPWSLEFGPFDQSIFRNLPEKHWTLLVQAVNLWVPEVKKLADQFYFLPPWRLDDIMVSYAPRGGSVGPHFDYYDVFLLQGLGQRKWQLGQTCDSTTPVLPDTALRILSDFEVTQEWLLGPGDILYVPPKLAHWGTACNDCLTYSIGFRSPSLTDMLGDLTNMLMTQNHSSHYKDPPLTMAMAKTTIDPMFIQQAKLMLNNLIENDELLNEWFARYMTLPKYPDLSEALGELRIAQIGKTHYINGERKI